jgi:hypothetical protein
MTAAILSIKQGEVMRLELVAKVLVLEAEGSVSGGFFYLRVNSRDFYWSRNGGLVVSRVQ